jgi:mannose-6-phosphate isomerase
VALYPFLLEPIYKEKVWGGRAFERLGRTLPGGPGTGIGESWELADLDATSPSGGGGAGAHSRIRNGPLRERVLREVVRDFGGRVTGRLRLSPVWGIPLLLKFLDARENVSVQVHPSPRYAAEHPDVHLKSEAWYIVDADPGAVIYKGVREGTTREAFAAAIEAGTVEELLIAVPARPGECHYLPSGTCHALGGGILVAEIQTPSDTTFRVYDWGRTDRELHVEAALECIDFGPTDASAFEPGTVTPRGDARARHLVSCEHFDVHHVEIPEGGVYTVESPAVEAVMVVGGTGVVRWGSADQSVPVGAGDTLLLPAALPVATFAAGEAMAGSEAASLEMLEITFPEPPEETP